MEEEKKKIIVPIVIGVLTLLVLVIGATYAYFAVGINNNFGTTTISASADDVGTVTLTNINSTLSMSLTAADMMRQTGKICTKRIATVCNEATGYCDYETVSCSEGEANCVCNNVYGFVNYYATPSGKSTTANMAWEIGRATVTPSTDTNYYSCDYTLSVSNTGTTNMYTAFTGMPEQANATQARPNAYKSADQVIFQINDTEYDWYTNGMPNSYTGNMIVNVDDPGHITAGLKLVNDGNIDQTDLAGSDITITIQATNFSCTAVTPTYAYYNYSTWNDGSPTLANSPGSMSYYVKKATIGSTIINEICGVFDETTICIPKNSWSKQADYYTTFTNAGASCSYSGLFMGGPTNEVLKCSLNSVTCEMDVENYVRCYNSEGGCQIESNGSIVCYPR